MMKFRSDEECAFWSDVYGYVIDGNDLSVEEAAKLADDSLEERRKRYSEAQAETWRENPDD